MCGGGKDGVGSEEEGGGGGGGGGRVGRVRSQHVGMRRCKQKKEEKNLWKIVVRQGKRIDPKQTTTTAATAAAPNENMETNGEVLTWVSKRAGIDISFPTPSTTRLTVTCGGCMLANFFIKSLELFS